VTEGRELNNFGTGDGDGLIFWARTCILVSLHHHVGLAGFKIIIARHADLVRSNMIYLEPERVNSILTNHGVSTRVILVLIISKMGLITTLLALYGYAARKTVSRRYLDRVSFRQLVYTGSTVRPASYAVISATNRPSLLFDVSFLTRAPIAGPGRHCALVSFTTDVNRLTSTRV
jgi:hypothetical protein